MTGLRINDGVTVSYGKANSCLSRNPSLSDCSWAEISSLTSKLLASSHSRSRSLWASRTVHGKAVCRPVFPSRNGQATGFQIQEVEPGFGEVQRTDVVAILKIPERRPLPLHFGIARRDHIRDDPTIYDLPLSNETYFLPDRPLAHFNSSFEAASKLAFVTSRT